MFKNVMKIPEETEKCTDIFAVSVCERPVYECKIAPENQSVRIKNVNCIVIFFVCHALIITFFDFFFFFKTNVQKGDFELKIGSFFSIFTVIYTFIFGGNLMRNIYSTPFCDDEKEKKMPEMPADPLSEKFLKTRQVLLSGEVNKDLADKIVKQLLLLEADDDSKPIYMFIDSPGGDVDAGFAIFDMIRFVKCPVILVGMGLIASAAALILLAVDKENRLALPNSRYLIHQPLGGVRGVATDIEIYAKDMEKIRIKINKIIAEGTGTPLDQVTKDTDRDYWLDAEESVKYGLISKIITKRDELK